MTVTIRDTVYRLTPASPDARNACYACCGWVDRDLCAQLFKLCDPGAGRCLSGWRHDEDIPAGLAL